MAIERQSLADPENRRLVENAPEMLELLREHQWCEGHAADCRLGSLLKRIDGQGQA